MNNNINNNKMMKDKIKSNNKMNTLMNCLQIMIILNFDKFISQLFNDLFTIQIQAPNCHL